MISATNHSIRNKMKRNLFNRQYTLLVMALMALMVLSVSSCKEDISINVNIVVN